MPFALPSSRRKGLVLRTALAATVLAGVGLALPSSAADAYTAEGFLEVPTPLSPGDTAFDLATCPELPPTQGVDVFVFDLPATAVVEGAVTTVTGTDAAGPVDLYAYVYKADCTYDRTVQADSPEAGLVLPLEAGDRFVSVGTPTGIGTTLALSVAEAAAPQPTLPPTPSAEPSSGTGTGSGEVVRRDYSGGVDDPLYPEAGTGPASLEFSGQWGMRIVRAEQAWQEQRATGAGITVAVLDSGLDVTHPDFACEGKVVRLDEARYPRFADVTDLDGHGTHVAGTVGACTDNGEGVVGVAPDARILPVQALSPTEATAERLAAAIDAATESGAHVINMSLGFSAAGLPATGSAFGLAGAFAEIDAAIERAVAAGVVVVAAAGNESVPVCGYPALAVDVVCVGSTDRRDLNAWYGNFPVTPEGTALVAPGGSATVSAAFCDGASEGVLSTYSRDATECPTFPGYRAIDGTSMATPHVAGVAALVYDRLGGVRSPAAAQTVIDAMASTAVDLYSPGYDPMTGKGRVDALAAVLSVPPAQVDPTPTGTATPTPTGTPQAASTTELVARATGQTTDALSVAAQVADEAGRPLADVPVDLVLTGEGGSRAVTATTDGSGTATAELPLDLAPGDYALSATVADAGGRTGSSDSQPFSVLQDDSALTATSSGNGASTRVTAVLSDADGSAGALAERTVVLLADGAEAGTAVTDASGTAVFAPTGRNRNARTFEVRYAGDALFLPSAASTPGR